MSDISAQLVEIDGWGWIGVIGGDLYLFCRDIWGCVLFLEVLLTTPRMW